MAGFAVSIRIDPDRFEAAITDLVGKVKIETAAGSLEAAEFVRDLIRERLLEFAHPRSVPTESPPLKGPVGSLTDTRDAFRLLRSVHVVEMPVSGFVKVVADAPYARIQEFGGWTGGARHIYHLNERGHVDITQGFVSETHLTFLPPRPYFRPAVMEVDTDPEGIGVRRIYFDKWRKAMIRAVAF